MSNMGITELSIEEMELVDGGTSTLGRISAGMAAASIASGGLALIPTPATPALAGFSVLTGLISAGAAYLASY